MYRQLKQFNSLHEVVTNTERDKGSPSIFIFVLVLCALCVYYLVSTKFYREKSDKPGIVKIDSEATEWYLAAG